MAETRIMLKLSAREFDLIRNAIKDRISDLNYGQNNESIRDKQLRKQQQAQLQLLLTKL